MTCVVLFLSLSPAVSQIRPGLPSDMAAQALVLLRPVKIGGNPGSALSALPPILRAVVGKPCPISIGKLRAYLQSESLSSADYGGELVDRAGKERRIGKTYFVIHDTSDSVGRAGFPTNIDSPSYPANVLSQGRMFYPSGNPRAHAFVNRAGSVKTAGDFGQAIRAVKREANPAMRDICVHIELVQPRIKGAYRFEAVPPSPAFTVKQYDQLALLYVTASIRRGRYLVPAYHFNVDLGLPDGHDDPQGFDLGAWDRSIESLVERLTTP